nr:hypothetical protein [Maliibacterium massiliense]
MTSIVDPFLFENLRHAFGNVRYARFAMFSPAHDHLCQQPTAQDKLTGITEA